MSDCMTFPNTVEEFMEKYKVVDTDQVYSNGTEFVPIFRMKQWFEHQASLCEDAVSRQALLDMLHRECSTPVENFMKKKVNALSSVQATIDENRYCDPFGNPIYVCLRIGGNDVTLKAYDIVKAVEGVVTGETWEQIEVHKYEQAKIQPEETCDTCEHSLFRDSRCEECRVGRMSYPSYYERRTDGVDS